MIKKGEKPHREKYSMRCFTSISINNKKHKSEHVKITANKRWFLLKMNMKGRV